MDEQLIETCSKLQEIGLQNDYSEFIDADFLEEISNLPLNQHEKVILMDDVANLRYGMTFLQERTNQLIRLIVYRTSEVLWDI